MTIPDFTDSELWVVGTALKERFGREIELRGGESDVPLDPKSRHTTPCPAVYWQAGGVGFVICKTGERRYRSMFFYSVHDRYGTGRDEYDDLAECVSILLKLQADTDKERAGASSGRTADGLSGPFPGGFVDF